MSLGANDNPQIETMVIEEFILGVESRKQTPEELEILTNVTKRLDRILQMSDGVKFIEMATQSCSDLFVYIGEFC